MSDTAVINFSDDNFQSQHATKCDLLIQLSETRFSYAIIDQIQDQLKFLYSEPVDGDPVKILQSAFSENPVFKFHFRKVKASIQTSKFAFFPTETYEEALLPAYGKFLMSTNTDTQNLAQIRSAGIKNVSILDEQLRSAILEKYENSLLFSQAEPFIEAALKFSFKPMVKQAFIQLNEKSFELLITEGKKVMFYNLFPFDNTDELNYFLLFTIGQTSLDSMQTPIFLSGEINEGDENFQRISKYFSVLNFLDSIKMIRIPEAFGEAQNHRFFSLLSLNTCA